MHHRIGSSFAVILTLTPVAALAQTSPPAVWRAPARHDAAPTYAQPASPPSYAQPMPPVYTQPAYAQPSYAPPEYPPSYAHPYPQRYAQPAPSQAFTAHPYPYAYYPQGSARPLHAPAGTLVPASYAYATAPGYGGPVPSYGPAPMQEGATVGSWGTPRAEASTPPVKTKDPLHYVELGMGAFIPSDSGNQAKLGLEANLWAIHGGWVPNGGLFLTLDASTGFDIGCMAARATDGCKGHLRIHWIGTGPFFNTGAPMIARDVPRAWDLMALTGAEVRLWKGMTAKATVNWFLPSPWGVYEHQKQLVEDRASGAAAPVAGAGTGTVDAPNPMDAVSGILGHALKHPQLNLMAMWEF